MVKKVVSKTASKKATKSMSARAAKKSALADLVDGMLAGKLKLTDLSATPGPDTPFIKLPLEIGLNTPKIEIHEIFHCDSNGPFWAGNWLKLG
jgi:hypothetical protein